MAFSPPPAVTDLASGNVAALQAAMARAGLDEATRLDLIAWLGEQLADERHAQLDRAGHDPKDRIPLARVLIDLPISRSPVESRDQPRSAKKVLAALCAGDAELFESPPGPQKANIPEVVEARRCADRVDASGPAGIVLIGGPGQGKSTITQSLSAVHHAALLSPHADLLDAAARDALDSIQAAQQSVMNEPQGRSPLPAPEKARFPLRIVLPDAAAWLIEQGDLGPSSGPALLRFVAERAARRQVRIETLAALIAHVDWLVILDGLDEVPAPEARSRILSEARLLIDDLHSRRSGGLIVATTRPQGYGGELDGWAGLRTWHLVQISTAEAQQYARQLVAARYETRRGERILARLADAARTGATARILRSPLQVTILVALIARIGRAPGERWSLFSEYYRIIYEREMERDHPAAELLRRYRPLIDRIHAHVGLLLQVETEQAAGTDATMTTARLRDVMHAVFADQGLDAVRRQPVVEGLIEAITERLVLLVERRRGHVGFEIRPLQELMAAWALAQKETLSEVRLLRVARSDAFREVVLFLASKAFAELSDVRDVLVDRVLPALNDDPDEPMALALLRGSMLAVEILEDGAALSQPKYVQKLAALGGRLIELPVGPILPRLAHACLADFDAAVAATPVLVGGIRARLDAGGAPEERISAWALLIALVDEGSEEARRLADERWAGDVAVELGLMELYFTGSRFVSQWLCDAVSRDFRRFRPDHLAWVGSQWTTPLLRSFEAVLIRPGSIHFRVVDEAGEDLLLLGWRSFQESGEVDSIATMEAGSAPMRLAVALARFLLDPTKSTLAATLEAIAAGNPETICDELPAWQFPWPIAACLEAARTPQELSVLAARARAGELGDTTEWKDAEERCAHGRRIRVGELASTESLGWPVHGKRLSSVVLPLAAAVLVNVHVSPDRQAEEADKELAEQLVALVERLRDPELPGFTAKMTALLFIRLMEALTRRRATIPLHLEHARLLWSVRGTFPLATLEPVVPFMAPPAAWLDLLDEIGRSGKFEIGETSLHALPGLIARGFEQGPHRTGLLQLIAHIATNSPTPAIDVELLAPDRFADSRDRDAAFLIRAVLGAASEAEAEQTPFLTIGTSVRLTHRGLTSIGLRSGKDPALQRVLFQGLLRALPPRARNERALIIDSARRLLGKTSTHLDDPDVWDNKLQLPMPRPERRSTSDRAPASPAERRPVLIDEIVLRNFRGVDELRIEPARPQNGHGQWIVLLGKNGLGKTTLLRGLVLALFDIDEPVRRPLPPTAYSSTWRRIGAPEEQPSFVRVKLRGNEHGAEIRPRLDLLALEQLAPISKAPNEMVFAYGVRRRYLVSDVKRAVVPDLYALVPSLFEEGADLLPIEESLAPLENAWHNQPESVEGRLHVELRAALAGLLRVDAIETRGQELWVRGRSMGEVPLKELSDGYLTLAAWVVDLVVRWWHQARLWKIEPASPILHSMTGLVLVDEIDLFLHPDWQRSVVRTLKELFPRMSFVVTTHNPLAILGASAAEIWILRRDGSGAIHAEQREQEPFRLTGSDLYEFYFGIESVLPDELGRMLHRYRQVAGDPFRSEAEDAEAREILGKLRKAQFDPGWEPVPIEQVPPLPEGLS